MKTLGYIRRNWGITDIDIPMLFQNEISWGRMTWLMFCKNHLEDYMRMGLCNFVYFYTIMMFYIGVPCDI